MTQDETISSSRWHGVDYLRATMSLAVIAWHMRLFGISSLSDMSKYSTHHIQLSDIINFNLLLLAVPVFFLISIFLQVEKWAKNSAGFWGRIERLTYIYCFWTGIFLIVCKMEGQLSLIWPKTAIEAGLFVISGGKSLFYFLFSLILLTTLSHMTMRLRLTQQKILTLFLLVSLWICPAVVVRYDALHLLTAFWNPLNFLIYAYIAHLLYRYIGNNPHVTHSTAFKKALGLIFILFLIAAICEWTWFRGINNFKYNGFAFPSYTRPSVAIGATFLFLLSFTIRHPPAFIIKLISEYSLGLYCVHGFVMFYYYGLKPDIPPPINRFLDFCLILSVSLGLSILLRRVFRKGLI